ncbi:MAG: transcription elongation factor GreA [Gammaproteobacteria bacterium]|nr:transcription elongation factor GreA [Gammaproteobacteria bacterium]
MITVTRNGYEKLVSELKKLKSVDRQEIISRIEHIRTNGGEELLENAEFTDAQNQQAFIEGKIQNLEGILSDLKIVDPESLAGLDRIVFGAKVKMIDEDTEQELTYQLVSEYESDVKNGLISVVSPVGRSLINRKVGDSVTVITPKSDKYFTILEIIYE